MAKDTKNHKDYFMEKKLVFIFIFIFLVLNFCSAYEDWRGEAHAYYVGISPSVNIDSEIKKYKEATITLRERYYPNAKYDEKVLKLTKQERSLLEAALNEYDLVENEVYQLAISIAPYGYWEKAMTFIIKINSVSKDGSYNYTWWGTGIITF